jgi:hypothetical protein
LRLDFSGSVPDGKEIANGTRSDRKNRLGKSKEKAVEETILP